MALLCLILGVMFIAGVIYTSVTDESFVGCAGWLIAFALFVQQISTLQM